MRQVETSRTIVSGEPCRVRAFSEALIAGNLDIGRPGNVEIIFGRRVRCDTPGTFRTATGRPVIDPDGKGVVVNIFYKHSRGGQYLKDGRALRIETVINCPRDLACNARLPGLAGLQDKSRAISRRILETERAGQGTVLASPASERIAHPSVTADGRRTPALRFGDPRVMALAGALCNTLLTAAGITSKSLRALMTALLNTPCTPGQMTYDLRRLRLAGLIRRTEFSGKWEKRYPAIIRLWENAWAEFVPFLRFDREIRTVICTTNAIESVNARLRRAVNARGHFPTEQAAMKCLYLAIMSLDPTGRGRQRWTSRWKAALNAFDITFDGRLSAGRK